KMELLIDPTKKGLEKVLRNYQIESLKIIWDSPNKRLSSREIYQLVNKKLNNRVISRASIINFLNDMCNEKVLKYEEEPCKGGVRRRYYPSLNEAQFKKFIVKTVVDSLAKDFPEQTVEAVKDSFKEFNLSF
ncbi:BlaI/MecI/CopY family transcriptional regulator, partial [Candidatus Bathyarchaeota archaeon]|nr:BlaI/MecI/CopY family transcriptional regulator [Candidatus Bathyarchaeota archaeon]